MFKNKLYNNIIMLACKGLTNMQIAEELYYSEAAIKKHLSRIYKLKKIKNRKELKDLYLNKF